MKMKTDILENLDRLAKSAFSSADDRSCILNVVDYVDYALNISQAKSIITAILKEMSEDRKKFEKSENDLIRVLQATRKEISKLIKENKIPITKKELGEQENEGVDMTYLPYNLIKQRHKTYKAISHHETDILYEKLIKAFELIKSKGYSNLIEDHISDNNKDEYKISDLFWKRHQEKLLFEGTEICKIWGCWDKIAEMYFMLSGNDPKRRKKAITFMMPKDLSHYKALEISKIFGNKSLDQLEIEYFKRQGYINSLERFHNYLVVKLKQEEESKTKFALVSLNLDPNIKWENIEIKLVNDYDAEIFVNNKFFCKTNYEKMGFAKDNTKDRDPDKQWHFLHKLSVSGDELKLPILKKYQGDSRDKIIQEKEIVKQQKRTLSKKFKDYFGLEENPFFNYKDFNYYKPKFKISPIPYLRDDGEIYNISDDKTSKNAAYADTQDYISGQMT